MKFWFRMDEDRFFYADCEDYAYKMYRARTESDDVGFADNDKGYASMDTFRRAADRKSTENQSWIQIGILNEVRIFQF